VTWKYVLRRTLHEYTRNGCTTLAAALTYYGVLALFPALLALVSLLGIFGQAKQSTDVILQIVGSVADESTVTIIRQPLEQLANAPGAGFVLAFGVIAAIWSASGYVGAFSQAMNRIYDVDEGRPLWKRRPMMLLITVVMLIMAVVVALLLIVSGPVTHAIGDAVGLGDTAVLAWNIAKWPILVVFAVVMIAVLYYGTPNVKQPKFEWISMGSVIALIALVVASLGFFFYVANFAHYNSTYGSIGGVIVLLLWLWLVNLSLLFGAQFNAELERARELQGGIEAEEAIQLPPRDTRQSEKARDKERQDVERGRAIRKEQAPPKPQNSK
jgi:membrane protein